MLRRINISINKFIVNYLPIRLRKPNRKNLLYSLNVVFNVIHGEMQAWRDDAIVRARVTGETMSIEWHLNDLYGSGTDIYIETAGVSGVPAGIQSSEVNSYLIAGIQSSEASYYTSCGLFGEDGVFGTKKFVVYVPSYLSAYQEEITSIVNTYRDRKSVV